MTISKGKTISFAHKIAHAILDCEAKPPISGTCFLYFEAKSRVVHFCNNSCRWEPRGRLIVIHIICKPHRMSVCQRLAKEFQKQSWQSACCTPVTLCIACSSDTHSNAFHRVCSQLRGFDSTVQRIPCFANNAEVVCRVPMLTHCFVPIRVLL